MRDLGVLWERCNNGEIPIGEWDYERRLTIDGVVYLDDNIMKVTHDKGLIGNSFSVGNCISGTINATVIPHTSHIVRRNSKVLLELRIATLNDGVTNWFEFGHYYIDSAEKEKDKWTINGYDAINKLEVPFTTTETNWPKSCMFGLNQILSHLDIQLDPRTVINSSLQMQDPTELTMREVLGYIGGLHGGNWCITETNKLRLVIPSIGTPVLSISTGNTKKIIENGVMNFDKIVLKYGSSNKDKYFSGTGTNELEVYNPWGTQSTADTIRTQLSNYNYYPGEVKSTELNPAVELGDTIQFDGELVNLWQVNYSTRIYADIYMPDQTDKFQDTYEFAASEDYEDRIDLLEEMLGVKGCVILTKNDLEGYPGTYSGSELCIILPKVLYDVPLNSTSNLFEGTQVQKVIGSNNEITSMAYMFQDSIANKLDLSMLDTHNVEIMEWMFSGINLLNLDLSNFDTSKVTRMERMFLQSIIDNLNLSSFNTSNVTDMYEMFRGAQIDNLNLSNFNTSKVTRMHGMFNNLNTNELNVSNFNTSNVTSMSNMFSHLKVSELNLSSFDTSKVESVANMFNLVDIENLALPTFNLSMCESMNGMFSGSKIGNLNTAILHAESNNIVDMSYMFSNTTYNKIDLSNVKAKVSSLRGFHSDPYKSESYTSEIDISGLDLSNANLSESIPKRSSGISYATGLPFSDTPLTVVCRSESDKALLVNQYFEDNRFDEVLEEVSEVTFVVK